MDNDFHPDRATDSADVTAAQAREALNSLDTDGAELGAQIATPWWFHLSLGLIVGVIVEAQALPGSTIMMFVLLPCLVALGLVIGTFRKRYKITAGQTAGAPSALLLWCTLGTLAVAMAAGIAIKYTESSLWWGLLPAAYAFGTIVFVGRRYDRGFRRELARDSVAHS
jgi:hypothetical protein